MHFYLFRKAIRRLPGIIIRAVPLPDPEITEGFGSRSRTGELCKAAGAHSVLLVTDSVLCTLGFHENVEKSILDAGISCSVFSDISSEPTADIISKGRKAAVDCGADCIVALGGGSVMDCSKIIAASAKHPKRNIRTFLIKCIFTKTLPMITIPTTAGTGAEMTVGAVVKNSRGVKKCTLLAGLNVTDVILDSELTVNAPAKITVCCGIDAMSHGLEGCLADVKACDEDMRKSRECVRLVLDNLAALTETPHDIARRQNMCLAANLGGNAINKQLAGYVHAFAHSIGGRYNIPHGEAIAYCLLPVLSFYRELCSESLYELALYCRLADNKTAKDAAIGCLFDRISGLLKQCGFTGGLSALKEADYPELVREIDADSINYSPVKTMSDREILSILDTIRQKGV